MQKITVLVLFILCVFTNIHAQSDLLDATITDKNGKEISGVVDYQERGKSPREFFFKSKDTRAKIILPIDIQGFTLIKKSEKYISAILDLNNETMDENKLKEFATMKEALKAQELVRDTVFLLTLATGELNLYSLIDKNSKTHFFYQKGNAPIKELIYRKVKIGIKEGENANQTVREIKAYATQLKTEVLTCPKAFELIKEESFNYKSYDLMRVVSAYNICKGKSTFIIPVKQKPTAFYVLAGVNKSPMQHRIGYDVNYQVEGAVNPVVGVGVDMGFGRNFNRFGAIFESFYRPAKAHYTNQSGNLKPSFYNFDMAFVQLNALLRYNFYDEKIKIYGKTGAGLAFLTKSDNTWTQMVGINNTLVTTTPETNNNRLNLCLAGGVRMNRFYVETRYDLGVDVIARRLNTLKSSYISLLVGYSFSGINN
jgi:hypothetical protein